MLNRVQFARQLGRRCVEGAAHDLGVLEALMEVGLLEIVDKLVVHALVSEGGEKAAQQ